MHSAFADGQPLTHPRRTPGMWMLAAGLVGIVGVVAGTFLPWVSSGRVDRNLYTMAGFVDRIGILGPEASVSGWLALTGPLCVIPVLLAVLSLYRWSAVVGLLIAVLSGGFAATVLIVASGRSAMGVSLAPVGPVIVLSGAVLLAASALGALLFGRVARGHRRQPTIHYLPQSDPRAVPERPH